METKDIIIIGGGAAGLMASCAAAHVLKKRGSVLVLEGNAKLGRKLLATGNGRCNLTNLNVSPAHYHGDVTAIQDLLHEYTPEAICAVFREMGACHQAGQRGQGIPAESAGSGRTLRFAVGCRKIRRVVFGRTHRLKNRESQKRIYAHLYGRHAAFHKAVYFDVRRCGISAPFLRRGLHARKAARPHGDKAVPVFNAVYRARKAVENAVRHARPCKCRAFGRRQTVYKESGEVQFTDTGISGICVFGLSVYAGEFFALGTIRNKKYNSLAVQLDLLSDMAYQDVLDYLLEMTKLYPARAAGDLLSGLLNMRLGYMLVGAAGIAQSEPAVKIKAPQLKKLASLLKGWRLDITGTKDFSAAQVTAGGVPLTELDPHTMASKKAPGLYLAGEMLNIHGDCGGYNLHFAWASGITAGKSAAYRCLKEEKR